MIVQQCMPLNYLLHIFLKRPRTPDAKKTAVNHEHMMQVGLRAEIFGQSFTTSLVLMYSAALI
jgi:hypothetical protein